MSLKQGLLVLTSTCWLIFHNRLLPIIWCIYSRAALYLFRPHTLPVQTTGSPKQLNYLKEFQQKNLEKFVGHYNLCGKVDHRNQCLRPIFSHNVTLHLHQSREGTCRVARLAQAQVRVTESRPPDSGSWVEAGLWQAACKPVYCKKNNTFCKVSCPITMCHGGSDHQAPKQFPLVTVGQLGAVVYFPRWPEWNAPLCKFTHLRH